MNFKMRMQGPSGGIPWEYDFTAGSEESACEYAKRAVVADRAANGRNVFIFNLTDDRLAGILRWKEPETFLTTQAELEARSR